MTGQTLTTPTTAATRDGTADDTDEIIRADGLTKSFGAFHALDGLDLEVTRGEVHGFLGPNGAGKSTTIRILLGLMRRSGGAITLFGDDPWEHAPRLHRRLAYVPGDVTLWPGLTGGQCIDVLAQAHGGIREDRRAELVERFDLDPGKRARDYSKGNRQKVALVAALAADVELLILDEPTSGLDPLMEKAFQQTIRERRDAGATVLLSSHILGEVEALADRVSIIRKGRRISTGTLAELRRRTRTNVHAVTERRPDLEGIPGVADLSQEEADGRPEVRLAVERDALGDVVGRLHAAGVDTLTVTPPSLDDLFLDVYADGGSLQ
jgi:ABC-2 type transport system ATP-binding protein